MKRLIRKYLHHFIARYIKRCGGAFHTYPYGENGRYVVIMNEEEYHLYQNPKSK